MRSYGKHSLSIVGEENDVGVGHQCEILIAIVVQIKKQCAARPIEHVKAAGLRRVMGGSVGLMNVETIRNATGLTDVNVVQTVAIGVTNGQALVTEHIDSQRRLDCSSPVVRALHHLPIERLIRTQHSTRTIDDHWPPTFRTHGFREVPNINSNQAHDRIGASHGRRLHAPTTLPRCVLLDNSAGRPPRSLVVYFRLDRLTLDVNVQDLEFDSQIVACKEWFAKAPNGGKQSGRTLLTLQGGAVCITAGNVNRYRFAFVRRREIDGCDTPGGTGCEAADQAAAIAVTTGLELSIDLADIGNPAGPIKIMVLQNNDNHDFLSNQTLGGLPVGTGNLGSPANTVDFSSIPGDQFFVIPEPSWLVMAGAGLMGLVAMRRRRRR